MKITPQKYATALVEVLMASPEAGRGAMIQNFLSFLRRRKQFKLLPKILHAFEKEWNSRHGIIKMALEYPSKFKDSVAYFVTSVEEKLGKKVDLTSAPSESLIGGYKVHIGDTLLDSSIEGQLKALERAMKI